MPVRNMRVIPPPDPTKSTILKTHGVETLPIIIGEGNITWRCGGCKDAILLRNVEPGQTKGIAFLCPGCGAYNVPDESTGAGRRPSSLN